MEVLMKSPLLALVVLALASCSTAAPQVQVTSQTLATHSTSRPYVIDLTRIGRAALALAGFTQITAILAAGACTCALSALCFSNTVAVRWEQTDQVLQISQKYSFASLLSCPLA